jgi:pimeloyl-ACP methyl ester carboxylesterase
MARISGTLLLVGCSACTSLPGMRAEIVDGRTVEYAIRGTGKAIVVFEAGLGDGMDSWTQVIDSIAGFATTFAYNRAGYGGSARSAEPRSGEQIVRELRATLAHAGLRPPYVLVGHSLGGTYMELFARSHPDEVAGLVLVESRAASMTRRCREARLRMCDPPKFLIAALPGAAPAEYQVSDMTFAQVEAAGPLPAIRLIVLTSDKFRLVEGPAWSALWLKTQRELATQSPRGEQRVTTQSGHYIQKVQPQLVIKAVRDITKSVEAY